MIPTLGLKVYAWDVLWAPGVGAIDPGIPWYLLLNTPPYLTLVWAQFRDGGGVEGACLEDYELMLQATSRRIRVVVWP